MEVVLELPPALLARIEQAVIDRLRGEMARREAAPEWLSDKSVALYADVSARTAKAWRLERGLPYSILGGNVRVRRIDLDKWLDSLPKSGGR
jgi:Helix-turn-helix domain